MAIHFSAGYSDLQDLSPVCDPQLVRHQSDKREIEIAKVEKRRRISISNSISLVFQPSHHAFSTYSDKTCVRSSRCAGRVYVASGLPIAHAMALSSSSVEPLSLIYAARVQLSTHLERLTLLLIHSRARKRLLSFTTSSPPSASIASLPVELIRLILFMREKEEHLAAIDEFWREKGICLDRHLLEIASDFMRTEDCTRELSAEAHLLLANDREPVCAVDCCARMPYPIWIPECQHLLSELDMSDCAEALSTRLERVDAEIARRLPQVCVLYPLSV